ncbi:hypothetical protein [Oscillatoria acuminata]|uniref:Uncharacterized protein n=1 Tax=Oscillatoria acuminata PCC 6304 TaxID=56110 RepID=K9TH21_9CYAN|nr:hypothetical protein [Oscillatoria acuminata]AFY82182.1 hypothetical protein Oscil6304_2565 [Oscillatoria acuminata PCC 6304]
MTKPHWLEMTESVALAGSVLGPIAVAGTQQVLDAEVPLTVWVSLNWGNRQQLFANTVPLIMPWWCWL